MVAVEGADDDEVRQALAASAASNMVKAVAWCKHNTGHLNGEKTIQKHTRGARSFSLTTPLIKNFNIPGMGTIGNSVFRILTLSH